MSVVVTCLTDTLFPDADRERLATEGQDYFEGWPLPNARAPR
jgi:hypothetical protein